MVEPKFHPCPLTAVELQRSQGSFFFALWLAALQHSPRFQNSVCQGAPILPLRPPERTQRMKRLLYPKEL